jgi:hypothetical protein
MPPTSGKSVFCRRSPVRIVAGCTKNSHMYVSHVTTEPYRGHKSIPETRERIIGMGTVADQGQVCLVFVEAFFIP